MKGLVGRAMGVTDSVSSLLVLCDDYFDRGIRQIVDKTNCAFHGILPYG